MVGRKDGNRLFFFLVDEGLTWTEKCVVRYCSSFQVNGQRARPRDEGNLTRRVP